jgi:release factor glutamine methyltransferase
LAERAIEFLTHECRAEQPLVLDVGTGTGCIAAAVAKNVPKAKAVASDISRDALAAARRNFERHGLCERVSLVQGDMLDAFLPGACADLIVSNPPYVAEGEWRGLAPEITHYEPRIALAAGHDGLDCIRRLVQAAPGHLKPGGRLLCEIGHGQRDAVAQLVRSQAAYCGHTFTKDLAGIDRVLEAVTAACANKEEREFHGE